MKKIFSCLFLAFLLTPAFSQFTRITSGPQVEDGRSSYGVAWIDIDNDNDQDLFVTVGSDEVSRFDLLYKNNGDGTFTRVSVGELVTEEATGRNATWGDYNNDGFPDVFVTSSITTSLFSNVDGAVFEKLATLPTTELSFDSDHAGGAWGDYDNDGDLDLFLSNYAIADAAANVLFENGPAGFVQVNNAVVSEHSHGQDPSWIDFDNNGTLDLFAPNYFTNSLYVYKNNGDKTFTKITEGMPQQFASASIGLAWGDYDNDGDFDLVIPVNVNSSNLFYENNGDGTFTFKTNAITSVRSNSASWFDFDNDGNLDIVCVGGDDGDRTELFRNNGDRTFTDVSVQQGINNINYSWGVATADYDNDGFVDVFIANASGNNRDTNDILYRNNGNTNHWISIKLTGTISNRSAIGANVFVFTGNKKQSRTVQSKSGPNSQNSLIAHFGLANSMTADSIVVEWPLKGFQILTDVPSKNLITVEEAQFPARPGNLVAENTDLEQITLSWSDNSGDETGFRIDRSVGDDRHFVPFASVAANTTTYVDTGADEGVVFYYRFFAQNIHGVSLSSETIEAESVITGIETEVSSFNVYPNPFGNTLNIVGANPRTGQFHIKNVLGTTLKSFPAEGPVTLSVEDLPPGIYLVTNERRTLRVVKMP